jgi:hypothetical protein
MEESDAIAILNAEKLSVAPVGSAPKSRTEIDSFNFALTVRAIAPVPVCVNGGLFCAHTGGIPEPPDCITCPAVLPVESMIDTGMFDAILFPYDLLNTVARISKLVGC